MNKSWVIGVAALLVVALGAVFFWQRPEPVAQTDPEGALTYFIDSVTAKVKTGVENYDQLGLGGEVDGFSLRKVYPNLTPQDFAGVEAYQGSYSEMNGELYFTGHAASNSAVIRRPGMQTLLSNVSTRLGIPADTKEGVDRILRAIE